MRNDGKQEKSYRLLPLVWSDLLDILSFDELFPSEWLHGVWIHVLAFVLVYLPLCFLAYVLTGLLAY